jgi:hypothetical protein
MKKVFLSFEKVGHRFARESDARFAVEEREAGWGDVWKVLQQFLCFLGEAHRVNSGGCDWDFASFCMWRELDFFFSEIV